MSSQPVCAFRPGHQARPGPGSSHAAPPPAVQTYNTCCCWCTNHFEDDFWVGRLAQKMCTRVVPLVGPLSCCALEIQASSPSARKCLYRLSRHGLKCVSGDGHSGVTRAGYERVPCGTPRTIQIRRKKEKQKTRTGEWSCLCPWNEEVGECVNHLHHPQESIANQTGQGKA